MARFHVGRLGGAFTALLLLVACDGQDPVGGESHFISCASDADCAAQGAAFVCVNKVCQPKSNELVGRTDAGISGAGGAPGRGGVVPDGASGVAGAATVSELQSVACPDAGQTQPSPLSPDASVGCPGVDISSDPNNCGACGNVCAGASLELTSFAGNASALAVDATSIYWVNYSAVYKMPLGGGAVLTLATNQSNANSVAVDATNVYWTSAAPNGGTVAKVPLSGGSPTVLATGQVEPQGLAVDATHVYWANYTGNTVAKVAIDGGPVTTVASGQDQPFAVAVDATNVYWTTRGENTGLPSVVKTPVGGGPVTALARGNPGMNDTRYLAVDHTSVYFTNSATVMRVPIAGGAATILASGQNTIGGIALDATGIYWTSWNDGAIKQMPLAGGAQTTLAVVNAPAPIAVDSSNVYWLSQLSDTVATVMSLGSKTVFGAVRCDYGACACPGKTSLCFGLCNDTTSDSNNCGGCGVECGTGATCHCGACE